MWQVYFLLCGLHLYPKHLSTSNSMFLSAPSSLKVEVIPAICPKKLVNILVAMIEPCWKYEGQRPPIRPWEVQVRVDQSEPESLKQEKQQNSRMLKISISQIWNWIGMLRKVLFSKSCSPKKTRMLGLSLLPRRRLEGRSRLMFSHSELLSSKWARAARGRVETTTMRDSKGWCEKRPISLTQPQVPLKATSLDEFGCLEFYCLDFDGSKMKYEMRWNNSIYVKENFFKQ